MPISVDRIVAAARVIDPVFLHSPQFEAEQLGEEIGARVVVKVETVNPIRSFKGRGTDFLVQQLDGRPGRLVCASAGNFGQGIAYAARKCGWVCHIFAATTASPLKVERMRNLGAHVELAGRDFDEAKSLAREFAAHCGAKFVEDGREPEIAEGAGTIGAELTMWEEPFDSILLPLGNGALLGGIAAWVRQASPGTRVIGVCAAEAPSMERSWRAGRIMETECAQTIADGIAVRVPVPDALESLRGVVDDVVLVSEASLRAATRLTFDTLGIVVEPAGAAGIAALIQHRHVWSSGLVATVLAGGNFHIDELLQYND